MIMNLHFIYDESSTKWFAGSEERLAFCKCGADYLTATYEARGYVTLVEICDWFGVHCPAEWGGTIFRNNGSPLGIDYEPFKDFVQVFCRHESQ